MSYKKIGILSSLFGNSGALILSNVPKTIPKIPSGTPVKIGFSNNFSKQYKIKSWKRFKSISKTYPKKLKSHISNIKSNNILVTFEGISGTDKANILLEKAVFIDDETLKNLITQISYLKSHIDIKDDFMNSVVIEHKTGKKIGNIVDIWLMPANDVWVVETDDGRLSIPVIDDVIKKINKKKKIIEIELIPGLLDLIEDSEDNTNEK